MHYETIYQCIVSDRGILIEGQLIIHSEISNYYDLCFGAMPLSYIIKRHKLDQYLTQGREAKKTKDADCSSADEP